ncbi:MAG: hypothetical protein RTU92_04095 [Candidatus Thorarchaeota archaeon]
MPKAVFSIWWDNTLGPMVGRSYPEEEELGAEEALVIFMGHGTQQEAKIGYTNLSRGLVISLLQSPNCIAVLLEEDDDSAIVERNLIRVAKEMDLNTSSWDKEIKRAFESIHELIEGTTQSQLLENPAVSTLIESMRHGRLDVIRPRLVLKPTVMYPDAMTYLGRDSDEVERILRDLESAGLLIAKTYGRQVSCRQCGPTNVNVILKCPNCSSAELHKVYSIFCPHCRERVHTVVEDDTKEVICQSCKQPIKASALEIVTVEPLCLKCGTATDDPMIVLTCNSCGKDLKDEDILGDTGLAYYLNEDT